MVLLKKVMNGRACSFFGYDRGILYCGADCKFDKSGCNDGVGCSKYWSLWSKHNLGKIIDSPTLTPAEPEDGNGLTWYGRNGQKDDDNNSRNHPVFFCKITLHLL